MKLVYKGKNASIKKNTISAGLTSCRVYVYNQGFFPAFVIENCQALSLEFSLKRNLFAGSCHEDSRSAAFIALTSILLAGRTFLQKTIRILFLSYSRCGARHINIRLL